MKKKEMKRRIDEVELLMYSLYERIGVLEDDVSDLEGKVSSMTTPATNWGPLGLLDRNRIISTTSGSGGTTTFTYTTPKAKKTPEQANIDEIIMEALFADVYKMNKEEFDKLCQTLRDAGYGYYVDLYLE